MTSRSRTTSSPTPAPVPAPARDEAPAPKTCNVCHRDPEWRGLCSAHRQTHRGLADPKESSDG